MIKPLDLTHQELIQSRVLRQPREALSAGRALAVWLGLSLLGWAVIAALFGVVVGAAVRALGAPRSDPARRERSCRAADRACQPIYRGYLPSSGGRGGR